MGPGMVTRMEGTQVTHMVIRMVTLMKKKENLMVPRQNNSIWKEFYSMLWATFSVSLSRQDSDLENFVFRLNLDVFWFLQSNSS